MKPPPPEQVWLLPCQPVPKLQDGEQKTVVVFTKNLITEYKKCSEKQAYLAEYVQIFAKK